MRNFREDYTFRSQLSSEVSPLIRIRKDAIEYGQKEHEKRSLMSTRKKGDRFIMTVAGRWRTDVFEVTEDDIALCFTS